MKLKRTHYIGEIDNTFIGKEVIVSGWVLRRRDHGGVIFLDVRDRTDLFTSSF